MKRKIATLGETDITVHPAAGILLLLGLLTRWRALLICTYASIILHETAHAAVSALWHHPPQEVEITPLGAMMRLEDEERLPLTARISVILAGPLMTLILCALSLWLTQNGVIPRETGRLIFLGNTGILLVNLLPALPLAKGPPRIIRSPENASDIGISSEKAARSISIMAPTRIPPIMQRTDETMLLVASLRRMRMPSEVPSLFVLFFIYSASPVFWRLAPAIYRPSS